MQTGNLPQYYRNFKEDKSTNKAMYFYNKSIHKFKIMDNLIVKPCKIMDLELMSEIISYDSIKK